MSFQEPCDPVADDPAATAVPDPVGPDASQRTASQQNALIAIKDVLVTLDKVIRELFMDRCRIRAHIAEQRAALDDQLDLLEATDSRIDELRLLWDSIAARLGLRSNN
ncbi:hypothetical protein N7517_007713 [Penicillium concentricum]|uniref:Uncharacterized protein n=1 Tax=Penicillium concentricum TaxID=293559 RepID=A0A9W9SCP0_9EURO|nr:uncharacterized protein N7517_007713 [Penicillium concentricum]KAJ5375707.1 hypothetical protein N7517_007713 [Penicillium concentricum]